MKRYKKYIIILMSILAFCVSICFVPIDATRFIPIVEKQAREEFGVQIHVEKLIFRFGPSLKIKAPIMHLMYQDGQKFGQLDNVKFFVPWTTLIKDNIYIKRIYADKFFLKVSSKDKYLSALIDNLNSKDYDVYPNIKFHNYNISYNCYEKNKEYLLKGNSLDLNKLTNYKNIKVDTEGDFYINDKQYINYNIVYTPNIEFNDSQKNNLNILDIFEQIENLEFHSDIIADVKLFKDINDSVQISGLVNIDNISVLDPKRKNPKSFIYLTFLGNKTGILSNIYTAPDKKIYAEGVINNAKKPEIDLKVKTDKIELADVYSKIKLLVDCSKFKGIELLDGTMLADFNVKGDVNRIKSTGYLKVSGGKIKANGININNIDSDIDFSNNIITITNAIGYIKDAPIIIKGKIDKNINIELLMNKVELKHLLPQMGVTDGLISLSAKLSGNFENILHKENLQIEKFKAEKNNNLLSFDSLNINTNRENTAYISNINFKSKLTEVVKIPTLKLLIDEDKIKIPDTNIFMPNSKLQAKAEITNYNTNNFIYSSNISGFINSKDLSGLTKNSVIYPLKANFYGNKNIKNIESQIQLAKATMLDEPALVNFSAKYENNMLKIEDLSLSAFNSNFSNNFKANIKGSKKAILTGNIENLRNPVFKNIRIFIPQQLNINYMNTIAQVKGDVFINGKISQPEIVGQISATNIINQFMQFALSNTIIDFNKNVAVLNAQNVKFNDSNASINATVSTDFNKEFLIKNISIKSKYLNTDSILMYKDIPFVKSYPIKINDGKLYAERTSASLYDGILYFTGLNLDFKLNDNILTVKNVNTDMFNGKLAGSMSYNLKDDSFESDFQARGVSASPIFDLINEKKDSISGSMDFDTRLNGNLLSRQSLNGNVKFIIHNGHMGTLGKLEHLLYAQNVVSDSMLRTTLSAVTKAITLKDTGLFKYLRGDITMKNGIANINILQSQGPLMSLYIKGQYNPINDYAKLTVLGRLSDEIIYSLGAFGEFSINKLMIMLTGEDNKLNIQSEDLDKLPQLPMKNTKEFRSVINGILNKPNSVIQFNWISYSQKSYRQKELPASGESIPDFIEALPY